MLRRAPTLSVFECDRSAGEFDSKVQQYISSCTCERRAGTQYSENIEESTFRSNAI
jgi:hypothetical protein